MKSRVLILSLVMVLLLALSLSACSSTVTVTFETNGGTTIEAMEGAPGAVLNATEPTKDGFAFGGWYTDSTLTQKFDRNAFPEADMTLYASWVAPTYTVTFVVGDNKAEVKVEAGETVTAPDMKMPEGKRLQSWTLDGADYNLSTAIEADLTLVAKLADKDTVVVTLDVDGALLTFAVESGKAFAQPNDPEVENYDFVGWKLDNVDYDFDDAVTEDITLKATFAPAEMTVTFKVFDEDSGTVFYTTTAKAIYGTRVIEPANIECPAGQEIVGWKLDNVAYDITAPVYGNITLVAVTDYEEYTIEYRQDGALLGSDTVEYGLVVAAPSAVDVEVPAYYTFNGEWAIDGETTPFKFYEDKVTSDLVLVPLFDAAEVKVAYGYVLNGTDEFVAIDSLAVTADYATKLTAPAFTAIANNTFVAWVDADGNAFNFNKAIDGGMLEETEDGYTLTIYADLTPDELTIVFNFDLDGTSNTTLSAKWGDTIETVLGDFDYAVDNYSTLTFTIDGEKLAITDRVLTGDAITANYTPTVYSVTFIDGFAADAVTEDDIAPNTALTAPTPAGNALAQKFEGWFVADAEGEATETEVALTEGKFTVNANYTLVAVYTELTEATTAAELQAMVNDGGSVTLMNNIDCDLVIPAEVEVYLYLNGYTLSAVKSDALTVEGAVMVIDNVGYGQIVGGVAGYSAVYVAEGGAANLVNGTYYGTAPIGQVNGDTIVNYGTLNLGYQQGSGLLPKIINDSKLSRTLVNGGADLAEKAVLNVVDAEISGGNITLFNDVNGEMNFIAGTITGGWKSAIVNLNEINLLSAIVVIDTGSENAIVTAGTGAEGSVGAINLVLTEGDSSSYNGALIVYGANATVSLEYNYNGVAYANGTFVNNGVIAMQNSAAAAELINAGVYGQFTLLSDMTANLVVPAYEDENAGLFLALNGYTLTGDNGVALTANGYTVVMGAEEGGIVAADGFEAVINNATLLLAQGVSITGCDDKAALVNNSYVKTLQTAFISGGANASAVVNNGIIEMGDGKSQDYVVIESTSTTHPAVYNAFDPTTTFTEENTPEDDCVFYAPAYTTVFIYGGNINLFNGAYGTLFMPAAVLIDATETAIYNYGTATTAPVYYHVEMAEGATNMFVNATVNEHTAGKFSIAGDFTLPEGYLIATNYATGVAGEFAFSNFEDETATTLTLTVSDAATLAKMELIFGKGNVLLASAPAAEDYNIYIDEKPTMDSVGLDGTVDPDGFDGNEIVIAVGEDGTVTAPSDPAEKQYYQFIGYFQLLGWEPDYQAQKYVQVLAEEPFDFTQEITSNVVLVPCYIFVAGSAEDVEVLLYNKITEFTLTADITTDLYLSSGSLSVNLNGFTLTANTTNAVTNGGTMFLYNGTVKAVGGAAIYNAGQFYAVDLEIVGGGLLTPTIVNYGSMQLETSEVVSVGNNPALENGSRAMGEVECQVLAFDTDFYNASELYRDAVIENLFGGLIGVSGGTIGNANALGLYNLCEFYFIGENVEFDNTEDVYNAEGAKFGTLLIEDSGIYGSWDFNADFAITNDGTIVNGNVITFDTIADFNKAMELGINGYFMMTADITADMVIPEGSMVQLDLNGYTLTAATSHAITNNGVLYVIDGSEDLTGTVDGVVNGKAALYNAVGAVTYVYGGNFTRSLEAGTNGATAAEQGANGNSYYTILNQGSMVINGGNFTNDGEFSSLIDNGWYNAAEANAEVEAVLIINGGTFTGGTNNVKNDTMGRLTINGGTFTGAYAFAVQNWNKAVINGGSFAETTLGQLFFNGAGDEALEAGILSINGNVELSADKIIATSGDATLYIHGNVTTETADETTELETAMDEDSIGTVKTAA